MADLLRCFCPETKAEIQTDIVIDAPTLARLWGKQIQISCPHCAMLHAFNVREAYLQQALSCVPARSDAIISYDPALAQGRKPEAIATRSRGSRRPQPAEPHPGGPGPILRPTANEQPANGGWPESELHFSFRALTF